MDSTTLLLSINSLSRAINKATVWEKIRLKEKIKKMYAVYLLLEESQSKTSEMKIRKYWTRPIFMEEKRLLQGVSNNLIKELEENDPGKFFNYLRMTPDTFNVLLEVVKVNIEKQHIIRTPISARTRLEITIRYLASGDSMASISYTFRVGLNTVSKIIFETCNAIWICLKQTELQVPTEDVWLDIAKSYEAKWNFPHCIGAIDGKHIIVEAPPKSGSVYYNYKNTHSVNLLAVADSNLCFILVDIGAAGRLSDSGVFRNSNIGQAFQRKTLNLPDPVPLCNDSELALPYVLVGDEAFALTEYMMRPYPRSGNLNSTKKIFNYRLSRARRTVESAFGILRGRWRIFAKPINASLSTTIKIVQATVCLHNFIMRRELTLSISERRYSVEDCLEVVSTGLIDIGRTGSNTYTRNASQIRETFSEYFDGVGAVPWQLEKALRNEF